MEGIVLIGQGPTAETAIESLAAQHKVLAVFRKVTSPDDLVAAFASAKAIPLIQDVTLANVRARLEELQPACVVISSYDRVLPPDILGLSRFVNVHYGPLPRYRGRANVNWAIINREPEAAITVHCVDSGLDSGNILLQENVEIGPDTTVTELYEQLNAVQRRALGSVVASFLGGELGRPQEGSATYCCTRIPEDGEIDWHASTGDVYALIRSLTEPYPGAFTFFNLERLTVVSARPVSEGAEYVGRVPGRICRIDRPNGTVDVLTGDGALRLYVVKTAEGTCCPAASVIQSLKHTLGLTRQDLLKRIEQLQQSIDSLMQASAPVPQHTSITKEANENK